MRQNERDRARTRRGRACVSVGVAAVAVALLTHPASAQEADPDGPAPPQRAFEAVLEDVVQGDLLLIGNSNLLGAGQWRSPSRSAVDVDGDTTTLCGTRLFAPLGCTDNSSAADLDLPAGARIVHARLYVHTTLSPTVASVVARLDGPADGYDYTDLGPTTPEVPKLWEAAGTGSAGSRMRQAVWDVTDYVGEGGAGAYTVADIVNDRGTARMPYASWALTVAYELDPAGDVDLSGLPPEQAQRFASRAISWHDGFVVQTDGRLDVTLGGLAIPSPTVPFAKSFHVVAHGDTGLYDNLVFNGDPVGNNVTPGDSPPPPGVTVGTDPACNSIADVFNDSICVLGAPVATKNPGPTDYLASSDGRTPTSGTGVDMDVTRLPDRSLDAGATDATLSVLTVADELLAPGLLAVSIDLTATSAPPTAAVTAAAGDQP